MKYYEIKAQTLAWVLHMVGALLAGFLLFLIKTNTTHILDAINRALIFFILGFALSLALKHPLIRIWSTKWNSSIMVFASMIVALFASLLTIHIINFLSLQLFPVPGPYPFGMLIKGFYVHWIIFMVWEAAYFYIHFYKKDKLQSIIESNEDISLKNQYGVTYTNKFTVTLGKLLVVLKQEEISYFEADGDYVKVHSNEKSYLIRRTVRELVKELDPSIFQRIHRSFIINLDFVKVLRPHMNGEYFITLDNNTEIKTSRTYREVIKSYFK